MYAELDDDDNDSDSNNRDSDSDGESSNDSGDTVKTIDYKPASDRQKWNDNAKAQRALVGPYIDKLTRNIKGASPTNSTIKQYSSTLRTMRLTSSDACCCYSVHRWRHATS
jgi:hypothetical protein